MTCSPSTACIAFAGSTRIASGDLQQVVVKAKAVLDQDQWTQVLIFDETTSCLFDVDWSGTVDDVSRRIADTAPEKSSTVAEDEPVQAGADVRRPGRPKLGVVAHEVTLLPRHWEWLASQPGGASVALRKLVEHARTANREKDRQRRAQEAAYRFLSAMAGNEPGFEEATRALFACHKERFDEFVEPWPIDIREHAKRLAAVVFEQPASTPAIL